MEGYIIGTDEGVVVQTEERFTTVMPLRYPKGFVNYTVAIFKDKKEAQRVARNIKRRASSYVTWTKVIPATFAD